MHKIEDRCLVVMDVATSAATRRCCVGGAHKIHLRDIATCFVLLCPPSVCFSCSCSTPVGHASFSMISSSNSWASPHGDNPMSWPVVGRAASDALPITSHQRPVSKTESCRSQDTSTRAGLSSIPARPPSLKSPGTGWMGAGPLRGPIPDSDKVPDIVYTATIQIMEEV